MNEIKKKKPMKFMLTNSIKMIKPIITNISFKKKKSKEKI